ncbi:MerR family transcriptional regulator [Nocardia sp. NPDC006044]|uniref:DNA polymerase III subunit beta family protein n=1 Tax=Nocardia sp. NPDC006044 TaxID=3364306 RepID=UPI003682AE6C
MLARASGLTASALRFYDDCGLLTPARVDPLTGYRYYTEGQRERARLIRRLRAIEMPLESISEILSGDLGRAERMLDAHVGELNRRAVEAAVVAESIKRTLAMDERIALPARLLAEAFEQVRSAAANSREIPVLAGILLEATGNSLTLTATDRYRLSTRTLVSRDRQGDDWTLVVDSGHLAPIIDWLRDMDEIHAAPTDHGLLLTAAASAADDAFAGVGSGAAAADAEAPGGAVADADAAADGAAAAADAEAPGGAAAAADSPALDSPAAPAAAVAAVADATAATAAAADAVTGAGSAVGAGGGVGGERRCLVIDESFPDYRAVLSGLGPVRTRVLTARMPLLALLERGCSTVRFEVGATGIAVSGKRLPATVTGCAIDLFFEVATLLPAIDTAVGPDLMFDIAAADRPVVIRSATDGDLTTLAMPTWQPTNG